MFGDFSIFGLIILFIVLLISMTVHEFMHAYVGFRLGDSTAHDEGRISLNPLRHIDPFLTILLPLITLVLFSLPILAAKPVPFNPARLKYDEYGAALLAAAGPLSNLVIAFFAALFSNFFVEGSLVAGILQVFVWLNVSLFVFNMVPIPPLDGSRVLYAFAPDPLRRLLETAEPFGFFIVFALVFVGLGRGLVSVNHLIINLLP